MAAYEVELLHNTPIYWNTSLTEVHQSRHSIYVEFWIYTEFKNIRTSSEMKGRKIYVVGVSTKLMFQFFASKQFKYTLKHQGE